ncbi:MAG: glycosyltransferase [Opitutaceae bacterium]|jgi:hypothetical protein
MRVLITNNTLADRAGTELYVRDIALVLRCRGHQPIAYSSHLGSVADELRAAGITVTDDLSSLEAPPDVIHAHHHLDAMTALLRFPRVPAVLFCHGSIPWQEMPFRFPSIRRYVAIDVACHDRLTAAGVAPHLIETVRTFVDLSRFVMRENIRAVPRRALIFSNYTRNDGRVNVICSACARAGIKQVDAIGSGLGTSSESPEKILSGYDVVFAKGRAAHEAAATGAAVMVSDYVRFAGLLTSENYDAWRPLNFGHRTLTHPLNGNELAAELRRYDADDVRTVTERIRRDANLEIAMDRIIAIYELIHREKDYLESLPAHDFDVAASDYLKMLALHIKQPRTNPLMKTIPPWLIRMAERLFAKR